MPTRSIVVRSVCSRVLITSAIFVLVGCADNRDAEVTGTITVDGQAAEKGSISFFSADGKSGEGGGEIKDGKYTATRVPLGATKVQIRVPKVTGKEKLYDTPESPYRETFKDSLPKKYNEKTELTFDVKPGKNEKNWDLSTK